MGEILGRVYYNVFYFIPEEGGVRLEELVNWYLKEIEGEIETVQELTDKKLLVEKVIDRLVHHVCKNQPPVQYLPVYSLQSCFPS